MILMPRVKAVRLSFDEDAERPFLFLYAPTWRWRSMGWTPLAVALAWDGLEFL